MAKHVVVLVAGLMLATGFAWAGDPPNVAELGLDFVWVQPETFAMGSDGSDAFPDERPVRSVTLTTGFWMQTTEVTQRQWIAVMGRNPSRFKGDDHPVERVSWNQVQEFVGRLNVLDPGKGYRLPTEAEWEYACRAGTTDERYGELSEVAWFDGNSDGRTHPVGQKQPNAWGLYDMLGNVWEWCADWYGPYDASVLTDPSGAADGTARVRRGGSFQGQARQVRTANRDRNAPGYSHAVLGFRLVRER